MQTMAIFTGKCESNSIYSSFEENEENAIREEVEFIFKNIESQNNPIWNKSSHYHVDV